MPTNIEASVSGIVWKIAVKAGDRVGEQEAILILECMKMEIPLLAERAGTVSRILVAEGDLVSEGDVVAVFAAE